MCLSTYMYISRLRKPYKATTVLEHRDHMPQSDKLVDTLRELAKLKSRNGQLRLTVEHDTFDGLMSYTWRSHGEVEIIFWV